MGWREEGAIIMELVQKGYLPIHKKLQKLLTYIVSKEENASWKKNARGRNEE